MDVTGDEVSKFRYKMEKLFGPSIHGDSDGSITRDAVLLVSLPGIDVQSYRTDQRSDKDGYSVIYASQENTSLENTYLEIHTSGAWQELSVPNKRTHSR